jgi:DNA-binding response OmpR family regulator
MDPRLPELQLTTQQARILWCLYMSADGFRTCDELAAAGHSRSRLDSCGINTIITHLRKKLAGTGIAIVTHRGSGYYLPPASIGILKAMLLKGIQ